DKMVGAHRSDKRLIWIVLDGLPSYKNTDNSIAGFCQAVFYLHPSRNDTMAHDVWVIYFCKALTLAKTNCHGSNKQ
ncbi:MAG: hypothetical protein ACKVKI_00200, partial [Flavobacteriales bacterium]